MVIGGGYTGFEKDTTEIYKPSIGEWSFGIPLPNALGALRAVTLNNLVFVSGFPFRKIATLSHIWLVFDVVVI